MNPPAPDAHGSGNALPAGTRLAEFELQGVIGEGGFGIVYRAWDHSLGRVVAIKEYMPASLAHRSAGQQVSVRSAKHAETFAAGLRSFVKEARLLAQFDHPALVKVYRFWEAHGTAYMVMPFYDGVTLREELRRRGTPPDEATLLGWLGPIADALAVLHAQQWYHRDVAPDNVLLLAGSGRPVLLDFGAARRVIGDMTQAPTVILKPGYAPVEQYAEIPGLQQGPWTDVYALAALAYAAVRGRPPPPSVGRLVDDRLEPLVHAAAGRCSERVLRAIDHGLALRPAQRPPSIAAFKAELGLAPSPDGDARLLSQEARTVAPPRTSAPSRSAPVPPALSRPVRPPAAPRTDRRGLLATAGVAAVVAAGGGGAWWWSGRPAATPAAAQGGVADASPAPPPGAGPAAGFDPVQAFRRVAAAQTPGWDLTLTAARAQLRRDRDALSFTLLSRQDGQVLVWQHGTDGSLRQLYPNALGPAPQVRRGQPLTLPHAGLDLTATGPAGTQQLLVMVSRWPRDRTAFAPKREQGFTSYPTGSLALALEGANGGRLPLLAGRPVCPPGDSGAACADAFGAALLAIEVID